MPNYLAGFPSGSHGKESACNVGNMGSIPGLERFPGEVLATHSSILAWRIPIDRGAWWTMRSQQVRHDWATKWSDVKYLTKNLTKNFIMCLLMVDKIINITLLLPVLNLSIFLTFANLMSKCYYFKISIFMNIREVDTFHVVIGIYYF